MRIITWNCNGALRKRTDVLDALDADVLIIQECENPAESTDAYKAWAGDYLWSGTSRHKGIGVFPKKGANLRRLDWAGCFSIQGLRSSSEALSWRTEDLHLFLPFSVNDSLQVLAVWTKGGRDESFPYMGQFWKYLQIHRDQLSQNATLIAGDFNSNACWDKSDRWWNHSDVVDELRAIGVESLYHRQYAEAQGSESRPTFYHRKNPEQPYHIDYIFASKDLLPACKLRVGVAEEWLAMSDHMPMILTL